ncbi:hypothetical protein D8674_014937 [Pyrus ussuriensis x Pyrus communis]|uniref:Uncharacterized protein n=1 Tax=Pyrus ussuriensis x Pyrus communis TaxID=2448454 RepID=A0A5N5GUU4_9ROSA|nr:hypothetical protein D8674_014937 [Pyrus ussuriensis x Pyrus communis]
MEGVHEAPHDRENPKDPLQEELDNMSTLSPLRCIYRVPKRLRWVNEKAYTPQVVSIGPLHHGKEHLKAMEEHKKRYLRHFLGRMMSQYYIIYFTLFLDQEGRLRGSYAEPIEFGSDQFVGIVLVDAAFVIEFLLRCRDSNCEGDDYIFNNPMMRWDMLPDLRELKTTAVPNAAELLQAGVKFTVGKGSNLFDIKFSDGILEILTLIVADTTDLTLRYLLAFEQCHKREEDCLTSYVFLMKRLAKTPKDVELLVEHGIIENWLGSTKKISTLLHDLGTGMIFDYYSYAPLCENLNSYCRTCRHKWMANLRQNYFNTPWSIISVVGAVILLILTFIQTVCTVISAA